MSDIKDKINSFKREYEHGFTNDELSLLLESFPNIDIDKVNETMYGNTCMVIDEKIINYPWDVELAIRCGLENRGPNIFEWD